MAGMGGQRHEPAALPPGKTRYPLCMRLGGPQGRSGWAQKISHVPGFDPRTVQYVASRRTDRAIRPTSNGTAAHGTLSPPVHLTANLNLQKCRPLVRLTRPVGKCEHQSKKSSLFFCLSSPGLLKRSHDLFTGHVTSI